VINSRDGEPMKEPKSAPVLAYGKVRHVGDAYAVIAETEQQACDAVG
jgi:carbon-monoxide dehydrogenase large subunit